MAPGQNKADDIIDGRTPEVLPHPMGLSGQDMFEKGFFAGVESALGLNDYPPSEIQSVYHSNNSPTTRNNNVTTATIVQYSVDHAMEARDASNKKQEGGEKKLTAQEELCKHFRRYVQTYVHKDITKGKCYINPNKKGGSPPWATKKLKKFGIENKSDK